MSVVGTQSLETPNAVVEQFQSERKREVRESTFVNQKYHLGSFEDWTEEIELEEIGKLNGYVANLF